MANAFEDYASADAILWVGERWTVEDAGRGVSSVDGRHLLLASDGREYAVHERLVDRWSEQHPDDFTPLDAPSA